MADNELKYVITADGKQAVGEFKKVGAAAAGAVSSASRATANLGKQTNNLNFKGAAKVLADYQAATLGAASTTTTFAVAIRGLRRAMGWLGWISSVISLLLSLATWFRRTREEARETAEKTAQKLAETRKKVEELNQARLDSAQKAMRGFADETARARDNANALISAVNDLNQAQHAYDSSKIDLSVANGEMTKEEGDRAKALIATSATMDAADANKSQKWENLQAAKSVVANFEHQYKNLDVGPDGHVDTTKSKAYEEWKYAKSASKIHANDPARDEYKHNEEIARQNYAGFVKIASAYEDALTALAVAKKEYDAAVLQGDASTNQAVAAEMHQRDAADKGVAEALAKSERERTKAKVDFDVQRGKKSEKAGTLEKQRIDLEAELTAAREAFEARRKADEEAERDTESDSVLKTLENVVRTLEYKLEIVNDKAQAPDEEPKEKALSSSPTISSDQWARIGAFAGGGAQSETLRIQRGSYDALKAIKTAAERIQGHFLKPATSTL